MLFDHNIELFLPPFSFPEFKNILRSALPLLNAACNLLFISILLLNSSPASFPLQGQTHTHTHTLSHTLTRSHTHTPSLSLSHTLTHTHTLSLSLSLSHT